ncbi:MAG: dihydropyrimidinase [Elusimicrobiota bacterium]
MKKILIKGSRLVTEDGIQPADLLVTGGKIEKIAPVIDNPDDAIEIIAENMYTMPGIIDPHVHLELPAYGTVSSDDFHSGSCAAAAGGVTTIIDFAIPKEGQTMIDRITEKKASADSKSVIDFSFHAQINGWDEKTKTDMERTVEEGVSSFKIFMPATEGWGVGDSGLYEALRQSAVIKSLVMVHAENSQLARYFTEKLVSQGKTSISDYPGARPDFIEKEALLRASLLAEEAGAPVYICHISTGKAMLAVRELKRKGNNIYAETCPHYLLLSDDCYNRDDGFLFACCPPIRKKQDNYELWRGVLEGNIDVIGTDHCPFMRSQKEVNSGDFRRIPFGLPGVETSLSLMFSEGVTKRDVRIESLSGMMSTAPAKIFGFYPEKGTLREGSEADIVIIDPEGTSRISSAETYSNCDWSPYEETETAGSVNTTISRGEIIFREGALTAEKGRGRFIKRKKSFYCS